MATSRICMLSKSLTPIATRALSPGKGQTAILANIKATRGFAMFNVATRTTGARIVPLMPILTPQTRTLFSEETLRMDDFRRKQAEVTRDYQNQVDKYYSRMQEILSKQSGDNSGPPLYSGDLTTAIYLCDGSDERLNIVLDLVKYFLNTTANETPRPYFSVARNLNLLMQLLYSLDRTDMVVKLLTNSDEFPAFLDACQSRALELGADALFNNGKFQELVNIYAEYMDRVQPARVPIRWKDVFVAVITACFRLDTPEAYKSALRFARMGAPPPTFRVRTHGLVARMALKYGEPAVALELVSLSTRNHIILVNLRLKALAALGRIEDGLALIKSISSLDGKHEFLQDAVQEMREKVERNGDDESKKIFDDLIGQLSSRGMISTNSVDEILQEMSSRPFTKTIPESRTGRFDNRRERDNSAGGGSSYDNNYGRRYQSANELRRPTRGDRFGY